MLQRSISSSKFITGLSVVLMCVAATSCGDDKKKNGGTGNGPLDEFIAALTRCGVLSPGKTPDGFFEAPELTPAQSACTSACIAAADCEAVSESFCGGGGTLDACLEACTAFDCRDGGATVPGNAVCDGNADCEGAVDEENCEGQLFACDNFGQVSKRDVCDFENDCTDGSDEVNCPTFMCRDETELPAAVRCDGFPHCTDQSDEEGCPTFACSGDATISAAFVCNGIDDCEGGADEVGCAKVNCPDNGEGL
jgi:hypothetical protein